MKFLRFVGVRAWFGDFAFASRQMIPFALFGLALPLIAVCGVVWELALLFYVIIRGAWRLSLNAHEDCVAAHWGKKKLRHCYEWIAFIFGLVLLALLFSVALLCLWLMLYWLLWQPVFLYWFGGSLLCWLLSSDKLWGLNKPRHDSNLARCGKYGVGWWKRFARWLS